MVIAVVRRVVLGRRRFYDLLGLSPPGCRPVEVVLKIKIVFLGVLVQPRSCVVDLVTWVRARILPVSLVVRPARHVAAWATFTAVGKCLDAVAVPPGHYTLWVVFRVIGNIFMGDLLVVCVGAAEKLRGHWPRDVSVGEISFGQVRNGFDKF